MTAKHRIGRLLAATLVAAAVGVFAQGRGNQPEQPLNSRLEVVATLPGQGITESIGLAPDGSILVTGVDDRVLWRVSPDGSVDKFYERPSAAAFVGVTSDRDEVLLGLFQRPFRKPDGSLDRSNVGSQIVVFDRAGNVKSTIDGQVGHFLNGLAPTGNGRYLVTDTNGTTLLRVDTRAGKIEPWLKDESLAGMNGIKVFNGWVYVGTTGGLRRVQIDANGDARGPLQFFAMTRGDDFGIAPDGTIYYPFGGAIAKITPAGELTQLLASGVPNTTAAIVSQDGKWLYFATRTVPLRVMRLALN